MTSQGEKIGSALAKAIRGETSLREINRVTFVDAR